MRSGRPRTNYLDWWRKLQEVEREWNDDGVSVETTKNPFVWMNATSRPKFFPLTTAKSINIPSAIPSPNVNVNDTSLKVSYDGDALIIEGIGGGAGGTVLVALIIFCIYYM